MRNVYFVSLGCDKNLVDSEKMLSALSHAGWRITDQPEEADAAVINSCCFIDDAKEESIETILELAAYKETGRLSALIVAGCLAQRYREEILAEMPEVDGIVGTSAADSLLQVLDECFEGGHPQAFCDLDRLPDLGTDRLRGPGAYYAYLKIAEGCDKHCTYCVIPSVRGKYRSVPMEELLAESRKLADSGVSELILVAQETAGYGTDLYGEKRLPELLKKLAEIPGIEQIRLLYCYPEEITAELIAELKTNPKMAHYLDIPIQHASDPVLRRMGRRTTNREIRGVVAALRREIPDIALRTTLIAGFPGETIEDIETVEAFMREVRFDRLGVFAYSQEEGTPAALMDGQIPEEEKVLRRDRLMALQQEISQERQQEMVGRVLDVSVDGYLPEYGVYAGRSYRDATEVDGAVFFRSEEELLSGQRRKILITGASEYDLTGEIVDEFAE